MTAEIAIINRNAVTLATDSAVTLTVRGAEKVYNSADKLFELSTVDPMGIMSYNNLEFMSVSLEVVIKQFRDTIASRGHFESISQAADAFFKYLESEVGADEALQKQHARAMFTSLVRGVYREFAGAVEETFKKDGNKTDFSGILSRVIQHNIDRLLALNACKCFGDNSEVAEADITKFYGGVIDDVVKAVFGELPLTDNHKSALRRFCVLNLAREQYSPNFTGVVFAGFGEHELFPAVVAYHMDGIVANKLKRRETDKVSTDRSKVTGEILPFAQREMVDRFLYGVDPEFEKGIEEFLGTVISASGEMIAATVPRATKATKAKLSAGVKTATDIGLKQWRENMVPRVKKKFMQEVQDMIFLMPKQELAILAQELINLTSVKRKFSSGKETVGGPIDVAVISRIDGFVWVQRKHYFTPELNPRYFVRKFGSLGERRAV